jgi:DNA mismatch repair protein MutL
VRAGQKLGQSEVESLVAQMGDTPGSGTCPHGRPVAIRFPRKELERLFRRT